MTGSRAFGTSGFRSIVGALTGAILARCGGGGADAGETVTVRDSASIRMVENNSSG